MVDSLIDRRQFTPGWMPVLLSEDRLREPRITLL
jgi:hypothetical protein